MGRSGVPLVVFCWTRNAFVTIISEACSEPSPLSLPIVVRFACLNIVALPVPVDGTDDALAFLVCLCTFKFRPLSTSPSQ